MSGCALNDSAVSLIDGAEGLILPERWIPPVNISDIVDRSLRMGESRFEKERATQAARQLSKQVARNIAEDGLMIVVCELGTMD